VVVAGTILKMLAVMQTIQISAVAVLAIFLEMATIVSLPNAIH
jgi:hypothetical protein